MWVGRVGRGGPARRRCSLRLPEAISAHRQPATGADPGVASCFTRELFRAALTLVLQGQADQPGDNCRQVDQAGEHFQAGQ
ncbi:hypothetical protein D9M72_588960 [compost metagenome]